MVVISLRSYHPNVNNVDQIRLLEIIVTHSAVAIENSHIYLKARQEINLRERDKGRYGSLLQESHDAIFILNFKVEYQ